MVFLYPFFPAYNNHYILQVAKKLEKRNGEMVLGGIQKVRSPRGGGGGLTKSEQKRTGGGGAFTIAYVRFSKNCMANFVHAGYSYRII